MQPRICKSNFADNRAINNDLSYTRATKLSIGAPIFFGQVSCSGFFFADFPCSCALLRLGLQWGWRIARTKARPAFPTLTQVDVNATSGSILACPAGRGYFINSGLSMIWSSGIRFNPNTDSNSFPYKRAKISRGALNCHLFRP